MTGVAWRLLQGDRVLGFSAPRGRSVHRQQVRPAAERVLSESTGLLASGPFFADHGRVMWRSSSRQVSSRMPSKKSPSSGRTSFILTIHPTAMSQTFASLLFEKSSVSNPDDEFLVCLVVLQQVCFWSAKRQIREIVCAPTGDWYLMVNMCSHEFQHHTGIKTAAVLIFKR